MRKRRAYGGTEGRKGREEEGNEEREGKEEGRREGRLIGRKNKVMLMTTRERERERERDREREYLNQLFLYSQQFSSIFSNP